MSTESAELVTFSGTEAYSKQPEATFKPAAAVLRKVPGLIYIYAGPTVEDPAKGYIFIRAPRSSCRNDSTSNVRPCYRSTSWVSLQAYIDFTKSPLFDELKEALGSVMAGPLEKAGIVEHVDFRKDPVQGLTAPVTELVRLTLREGHTKEQVAPFLDQLCALNADVVVGSTWGWCVEAENQAVIVTGWKSIEAHVDAVQNGPENVRELISKLQEHIDVKIVHAKLVAF